VNETGHEKEYEKAALDMLEEGEVEVVDLRGTQK